MLKKFTFAVLLFLMVAPAASVRLYKKPDCNFSIGNRWAIQNCCLSISYQDGLEVRGDVHCFNYSETEKTNYQIEYEKNRKKASRGHRYH